MLSILDSWVKVIVLNGSTVSKMSKCVCVFSGVFVAVCMAVHVFVRRGNWLFYPRDCATGGRKVIEIWNRKEKKVACIICVSGLYGIVRLPTSRLLFGW